jgi:cytochrome oxidase Cu insertion factor (SCO1/SenC/PrrC family)
MSRMRRTALVLASGGFVGVGGGVAAALVSGSNHTTSPLPSLHGQVSWSQEERRAPAFALPDQNGRLVSLAAMRQRPVLLTFLDSQCHAQCPIEGRQLGALLRGLEPATRPTLLIVGVDPKGDTPTSIRHAMLKWRLAGPWTWHWLRGTPRQLARVWRAYGIVVKPTTHDIAHGMALYLIDQRGFERTGYLFPFLPNFVALDLHTLAKERT